MAPLTITIAIGRSCNDIRYLWIVKRTSSKLPAEGSRLYGEYMAAVDQYHECFAGVGGGGRAPRKAHEVFADEGLVLLGRLTIDIGVIRS